jgi:hypothetical protein
MSLKDRNKGFLIPLSLPKSLHEEIKILVPGISLKDILMESIHFLPYQEQWVCTRSETEKNRDTLRIDFPMVTTSLYIKDDELQLIEEHQGEYDLNSHMQRILYVWVKSQKKDFYLGFFDQGYINKNYKFSAAEYEAAFDRIKKLHPKMTQRVYSDNRLTEEPSLYIIRKKFGSFSNFIRHFA